jgi:hypothetical protein
VKEAFQVRRERDPYLSSPLWGKRFEATKVEFDDDAETTMAETQPVERSLMTELAWSKLYTKVMHKDLGAISTAIRKRRPTSGGPKMKKSAEKLRDQLKSANRTVVELSDDVGIRLAPEEK